jgi:hypothetical protein
MILALTAALPAAFAVGIAARRSVPASPAQTSALQVGTIGRSALWTRDDLWKNRAIQTRLLSVGPDPGHIAVELASKEPVVRPDVLVYWVSGERTIQNALPDDALLLGSFEQASPVPLFVPGKAVNQAGTLALYSLADQEVVAVSKTFVCK